MPFPESVSITLDGNGNGTIRLTQVPVFRARSYIVIGVSISTGESSVGGKAFLYRGEAIPSNFITGTVTPWLDTSNLSPEASRVEAGQQLTILFQDCDPGAIATVSATYIEHRKGVQV
jgi:hypothetical protein